MREKRMLFRILGVLLLLLFMVVVDFTGLTQSCSNARPTLPSKTTTPLPANLTTSEARGVVFAAINASTLEVRQSSRWAKAKWYPSSRQWHVTVWPSKEASEKYSGFTYIVDDATRKVLNPPPIYNPK
ncbi:hypothetical protein ACFLWB_01825 [Chloroflexota bacterium]